MARYSGNWRKRRDEMSENKERQAYEDEISIRRKLALNKLVEKYGAESFAKLAEQEYGEAGDLQDKILFNAGPEGIPYSPEFIEAYTGTSDKRPMRHRDPGSLKWLEHIVSPKFKDKLVPGGEKPYLGGVKKSEKNPISKKAGTSIKTYKPRGYKEGK